MCIPLVCQAKYTTKLVHRELPDISDLELGGLGVCSQPPTTRYTICTTTHLCAHLKLHDLNLVCYDRRLVALVEGGIEHLYRIGVELVGKTRPFECKGH